MNPTRRAPAQAGGLRIALARRLRQFIVAALLALLPAAVSSGGAPNPTLRLALEVGDVGPAGLERLTADMDAATRALARRFDPAPHADAWNRPAAWARLELVAPPALLRPLSSPAKARELNAILPMGPGGGVAQPFVLTGGRADRARALQCLTQAIYYEAALEPPEGQRAVAQTVLNRVRHPDFPKSVCGVVYEGAAAPGCQFSFACDGSREHPPIAPYWQDAQAVAEAALHGFVDQAVGAATYYHADYVFPPWALARVRVGRFGSQIFYRDLGPLGAASALAGRYAGDELAVSTAGPSRRVVLAIQRTEGRALPAAPVPGSPIVLAEAARPAVPGLRGARELAFGRIPASPPAATDTPAAIADLSARVPNAASAP